MGNKHPSSQFEVLAQRPARAAEHATENLELMGLARALTGPRDALMQAISEAALRLCRAGSAGISLVENQQNSRVFRWLAAAGLCAGLRGKTTAWDECPCGVTLDANEPQFFVRPQDDFVCLQFPGIDVPEGVVVPIPADGEQLGAIWVMSHTPDQQFDLEDVRLLSNLAVFAGAALKTVGERDDGTANDRRHNEFIAMLGHELRNPMAPIDGAIGAAKQLCAENGKALDVLTIAQRQMRILRTLVDDLLDAARLKHGKLHIKLSDTSLGEITFDAITAVKHHFESRQHTLKVSGLDGPILVRADHVRLSQVLGNVLSNAAKYTPAGGIVELDVLRPSEREVQDSPATVVIEVRDNGVGIDPAVQSHVFDLFAQSTQVRNRPEGGLGIGLAVAKRLVERHGGTISLNSNGVGHGTVVTLRLPIVRLPEAVHLSERKVDAPAPGPGSVHLLLVDDNKDALHVLQLLLELDGHDVTVADNGSDAVRLMADKHPEVAIVDVGMPVMDGFDVARAVRLDHSLDDVMLIALTGYASESDKSRALAAGFDYHLTKPLSLEKLQYILANRTGRRLHGIV
jgi:signal transduction histidine kinase/ActR/RegA family two-component response regulator